MNPARVRRAADGRLEIAWDDGHAGLHAMRTLRESCPCASCKTGSGEPGQDSLLPILAPGRYDLAAIEPVGSYALQLKWKDGHATGIYTYELLRLICECGECVKNKAE